MVNVCGFTVTETPPDQVVAPALSVARAVRTYVPAADGDHETEYGAVVSLPMSDCPAKNSTRTTLPFASLADAVSVTVIGMVNVAPFAGLVSNAEGGEFDAPDTTMFTAVDVVVAPPLSVARAVSEYEPAATFDHVNAYGLVVSVPRRVPFEKNSTFVTEPPGSLAVAVRLMFAPAVNVALFAGLVSDTCGGVLFGEH